MNDVTAESLAGPATTSKDVLSEVLRDGAQRLLGQAVEAEVEAWIESHKLVLDENGHRAVVRSGHLPTRAILTGVGSVEVTQPRVHDRRGLDALDEKGEPVERFGSKILPPYLRKAKSVEELIPWLYLKGVSTGDFTEALQALLGPNATGFPSGPVPGQERVYHGPNGDRRARRPRSSASTPPSSYRRFHRSIVRVLQYRTAAINDHLSSSEKYCRPPQCLQGARNPFRKPVSWWHSTLPFKTSCLDCKTQEEAAAHQWPVLTRPVTSSASAPAGERQEP